MQRFLLKQYMWLQAVLADEQGQDLIEYALVVSLIAFAAVAGMQTVASDINSAFSNIGTMLNSYS
jgi:pilus assembly protein Flp/PilA